MNYYVSPEERARKLLNSFLTEEQSYSLERYHYFDVKLPWRKVFPYWRRTYRIHYSSSYNVRSGSARFCITRGNEEYIPTGDLLLGILLMLRAKPRRTLFLTANRA